MHICSNWLVCVLWILTWLKEVSSKVEYVHSVETWLHQQSCKCLLLIHLASQTIYARQSKCHRNFRASFDNKIYLTLTQKRTEPCQLIPCRCLQYYFMTSLLNFFRSSSTVSLLDFEHSCKHSETFKITNPIVKL